MRKRRWKSIIALILIVCSLIAFISKPDLMDGFVTTVNECFSDESEDFIFSDVLRMHIVANSNSEEDQKIKLAVRDAILDYEINNTSAANAESAAVAEAILTEHKDGLLSCVYTVLKEYSVDYDAELVIGSFDFPEREYNGEIYPAGEYRAVRILLGEAEGKNWWCVMFPPLCIVEAREGEIDYDEPIKFESLLAELWRVINEGLNNLWNSLKGYLNEKYKKDICSYYGTNNVFHLPYAEFSFSGNPPLWQQGNPGSKSTV